MSVINLSDLDLKSKKVLIRQDLNVPIKDGVVTSDKRIKASLLAIKIAMNQNAKVILMSHLGRPTEGEYSNEFTLKPVAERLTELLGVPVRLEKNWLDGVEIDDGEVVLCENVRFNNGEMSNDDDLSKRMAAICDIFAMDAFGTAHRAQASTYGVAKYAPIACAGPLLSGELKALGMALDNPKRPMVAIVGGSKVSTKLTILESLSKVVDKLVVGGGIANTFIAAQGYNIGKSLCEDNLIPIAKKLMQNCEVFVPIDVVCAKEFSETAKATIKSISKINDDDMVFDLGPDSVKQLADIMKNAGTIVWNGPLGVFEFDQFSNGTKVLAQAVSESEAFSIAGGGDTLAAIDLYNVEDKITYISTGGGAFLEFLEGKKLPAVEILEKRALR